MLTTIENLPEGVIGFEATGELHASDYRDVLMPAVLAVWGAWRRGARRPRVRALGRPLLRRRV
jgi:hypothetical protein